MDKVILNQNEYYACDKAVLVQVPTKVSGCVLGIFTIFLMIADLMGLNEENESIMEGCKLRWERQGRVINLGKHM